MRGGKPTSRAAKRDESIFQTMLGFTARFDYNEFTFNRRAKEGAG
jgi:hypothetical protein